MGWVVMVAIQPLWIRMPRAGFLWLLLGGLAYSGGVVFYSIDHRMRYSHFIWHLFVLAGTACHFLAVYWYAA
jgi:hemolysin III